MFVQRCVQPASALPNTQTHDGSVVNLQVIYSIQSVHPTIVNVPLLTISQITTQVEQHVRQLTRGLV
jgi:hypothetical protein